MTGKLFSDVREPSNLMPQGKEKVHRLVKQCGTRLLAIAGVSLGIVLGTGLYVPGAGAQAPAQDAESAQENEQAESLEARRARIEAQVQVMAERFHKIAFGSEGEGQNTAPARKWEKPITLKLHQQRGANYDTDVRSMVRKLASLSGMAFNIVARNDNAAINLHIVGLKDYLALRQQFNVPESPNEVSSCFFSLEIDGKGAINAATIAIPTAFGEDYVRHCIVEELAQVMGLTKDSSEIGQTIFDDTRNPCMMSDQDQILIRALYNRSIQAGMSEMRSMVGVRQALFQMAQQGELDFMSEPEKDYGTCIPDYRRFMEGARMVGMIESLNETCENLEGDSAGYLKQTRKSLDEKFPTEKLKMVMQTQFDKGNNSAQKLITRLGCDGLNYKALFRRLMTYTNELSLERIAAEEAARERKRRRPKPFNLRKDLNVLVKAQEYDKECGAFRWRDREILDQYLRYALEAYGADFNHLKDDLPAMRGDFRREVKDLGCDAPSTVEFLRSVYTNVIYPPQPRAEEEEDNY